MSQPEPIPIERQIACVRREIGMRRRVYPRWIQAGSMTQERADDEIAAMEAVRSTLETLRDARRKQVEPGLFGDSEGCARAASRIPQRGALNEVPQKTNRD